MLLPCLPKRLKNVFFGRQKTNTIEMSGKKNQRRGNQQPQPQQQQQNNQQRTPKPTIAAVNNNNDQTSTTNVTTSTTTTTNVSPPGPNVVPVINSLSDHPSSADYYFNSYAHFGK